MSDFVNQSRLRQIIPGISLAGMLMLGVMVLREYLLTLTWALIIAYSMWPLYQFLRRQFKGKATLSALVMTAIIATVISLAAYWLVAMLQVEVRIAYVTLSDTFTQEDHRLPESIRRIPWLGKYAEEGIHKLAHDRAGMVEQFIAWAQQWVGDLAKFLGGIGHNVLKFAMVLITIFFCFRDGDEIVRQLQLGLVRFLGKYQNVYLQAAGDTMRAVVYGLVLAAIAQGILAGVGYSLAGLTAPILLGTITGLLALFPMGATLIWVPVSMWLILMNQHWQGIGLFLWGILAISTVDNLIRPLVISGTSKVPFLVVLFGVLGGLTSFGAVGLFLGPVVLAVLLSVWRVWLTHQRFETHPE